MKGAVAKTLQQYTALTDARTLKKLAVALGSSCSGNKSDIRLGLERQIPVLKSISDIRNSKNAVNITAIDMGTSNFAYCTFQWKKDSDIPVLINWNKIKLSDLHKDMKPPVYSRTLPNSPEFTGKLVNLLVKHLTQENSDAFFIERQRARTMGSSAIAEPILKINILEHMLYAGLLNKLAIRNVTEGSKYIVKSSYPRTMVDYWCSLVPITKGSEEKFGSVASDDSDVLEHEEVKGKTRGLSFSKKLRIALVRSLIYDQVYVPEGPQFHKLALSDDIRAKFENYSGNREKLNLCKALEIIDNEERRLDDTKTKSIRYKAGSIKNKNDDLSDALLHGLAWVDWTKNYQDIVNFINVASKESPNALKEFKIFTGFIKYRQKCFSESCITVDI
ncbi:cruciform cutting endonuclease Ecym_3400 [Eremothecium cymbalariae DBVPG|uniref:Mitochondrial resolvase Ydc2 catalytic domain-containing protein n=1 Tax=Eremothecium cymbalariae (strain CBS 270.75 / DBVPG 7215 / KCTC 17166 / NRRL Y-17582) TaxID=931890 RepID=G8JRW8_ERECY|nr:Hypothetical protein Ecym_3400 [Eremothecium cymbalariae DBVPG\